MPASKQNEWGEKEKALLEELAETMPFPQLVKAYNSRAKLRGWKVRRPDGIERMIYKLGFSRSPQIDCYTLRSLAAALGISTTPVSRWIEQGLLKAEKQGNSGCSHFTIYRRWFVRFALTYPGEISKLRLDESGTLWLLSEIAAGSRLGISSISPVSKSSNSSTFEDEDYAA